MIVQELKTSIVKLEKAEQGSEFITTYWINSSKTTLEVSWRVPRTRKPKSVGPDVFVVFECLEFPDQMKHDERLFELAFQTSISTDILYVCSTDLNKYVNIRNVILITSDFPTSFMGYYNACM